MAEDIRANTCWHASGRWCVLLTDGSEKQTAARKVSHTRYLKNKLGLHIKAKWTSTLHYTCPSKHVIIPD